MRGNMEITALLVSLIIKLTYGHSLFSPLHAGPNGASSEASVNATVRDTSHNVISREDPCISLCEKPPATFANSMYVKSCCQRGCRFFNLVDLRYGLEPNSLNGTRDACEASCTEAYTELQDRYACGTGCDFMAKQRVSDLLALFSIAICMEDGIDSNVLLSPDIPENDILTDPGLRKELLPRWWDSDGFKLPQTHVKTVPMDTATVDYALSSDYSGETEQAAAPAHSSDWFHCASRHIQLPYWYLAPTIVGFTILTLVILWVCLLVGHVMCHKEDTVVKKSNSSTVTLYIPLYKESLYKEPPPKYFLSPDDHDHEF